MYASQQPPPPQPTLTATLTTSPDPCLPPADTSDPGAGPRHFAWHPNGHWCYLINEIGATIHALDYATASGALRRICR